MSAINPNARVSASEVLEIVDTTNTALTADSTHAFINVAHATVQEHLLNKGLSDDILKFIEMYLAAHYLSLFAPRITSEDIANEYMVKFEVGKTGMGLAATAHGQQALAMDTTGTLASLGQKQANFRVF